MTIWNPSPHDQIGQPRLQFSGLDGTWTSVVRSQTADGEWGERRQPVPPGTRAALDFGSLEIGPMKFSSRGPDFSKLRPIGQPSLYAGDDPDFREGLRITVVLKGVGRRLFANNSVLVNSAVKALYDEFTFAVEASSGRIHVYILLPSRQVRIASRDAVFCAPEFDLCGWIERSEAAFGRRLVPTPASVLGRDIPAASPPRAVPPPNKPAPSQSHNDPDDLDDIIPF